MNHPPPKVISPKRGLERSRCRQPNCCRLQPSSWNC